MSATTNLPTHKTMEARLEAERMRLFEAMAVCAGIRAISDDTSALDGSLDGSQAMDIDMQCRVVRRLLNSIANSLDPMVFFDNEKAPDEDVTKGEEGGES